jgi:opacity protein-like surface antigen
MKKTILAGVFLLVVVLPALSASGQSLPTAARQEIDLAVTYNGFYSHLTSTESFWQQGIGGDVHVALTRTRHWGIAADVARQSSDNVAGSGVNLSQVTFGVGPRYTLRTTRWTLFGDALIGKAYATENAFPSAPGVQSSANSIAIQGGGGADYILTSHFSIRAIEAHWLRTSLPNGTTNVQNSLQAGAGFVYRP